MRNLLTDNQRGNSLVLTLFVIVLLSVIGLSLITITANTLKTSTNEREDQAVYYIAEAGLAERKAYLYDQVKEIYTNLKTQYEELSDPQAKNDFNFDEKFYNQINRISLSPKTLNSDNHDYNSHFNEKTESTATIQKVQKGSSIAFTITSEGKIGDTQTRKVSQTINISIDNVKNTENVSIGNNKPSSKLNACFALYANGKIEANGGGSFIGDIYSEEKINLSGSPEIDGNILSKEDIIITGTPTLIKGLYSEENITLSGGTLIDGNVSANRHLNAPSATIKGDVLIGEDIKSSASIAGNIKAGGSITIDNGVIGKDVLSTKDLVVNGGTYLGDVISKQNITIANYPNFLERGLYAIAKKNIHIKEWITPKKTVYSGNIKFDQNVSYTSSPVSESEVNSIIQDYEQKIINSIKVNTNFQNSDLTDLKNHVNIQNDCISKLPTLEKVDTVFTPAPPITQTKPNILIFSNNTSTLDLSENNNVYINEITMADGSNLIIDLNGGDHTLYVDSLTSAGNIKLVNAGSLKIFVKNKLNLTNSSINMDGQTSKVSIYYEGKDSFYLGGASYIKSNLHVKDANVTITGSGHLYGDLYVYGHNEITIDGGSSAANQLILAPYSKFTIGGGAEINGNVIVDTFTSSGGFKITKPSQTEDGNENGGNNGGDDNSTSIPVSDYGDADHLFTQEPQLEIDN